MIRRLCIVLSGLWVLLASINATASPHLIQIQQVIGGICGDTSLQAVQLRMRTAGQGQVSGAKLVAYDREGLNPVELITIPSDVAVQDSGSTILVASPRFASAFGPVADFVTSELIPHAYYSAGRLTFENDDGTIYWSLSWGGSNYTGSASGDTTNDFDGRFGPPFPGYIPTSTASALRFLGEAIDPSESNDVDYAWTQDKSTFTNNAGASELLDGCIFGGGFEIDLPLAVQSTIPANDAVDVLSTTSISASFNRDVNPSTLHIGSILLLGDGPVSGSVTYTPATRTSNFIPAEPLAYDTVYTGIITTAVKEPDGQLLPVNYSWSFATAPDTEPPVVESVLPTASATDVARDKVLKARFNENVAPSSVNNSTFRVDNNVWGSVTYSPATRTATLTPYSPLPWSTELTATISGVRDLVGNTMASPYEWSFTTEDDLVPPEVTSLLPLDGAVDVPVTTVLKVSFSEPMDAATINGSSFVVGGVTGTVSYHGPTQTAIFTPDSWLPADTLLIATITTAITDAQGNPLPAPVIWSFTTEVDDTPPTVALSHPIDDARIISRDTVVQAVFSEPMNGATITTGSFSVSDTNGTVSYDPVSWTATFTPTTPFPAGVTRTATITTTVQDAEGNALATNVDFTFRVVNDRVRINTLTAANHDGLVTAFKADGDGMAVWRTSSGASNLGGKILAAKFSAIKNSWSTEVLLASYSTGTVSIPVVATNGTTFLAVWAKTDGADQTLASTYSGSSWENPVQIKAVYKPPTAAVSNGSGYAVHSYDTYWVLESRNWTRTVFDSGSLYTLAGSSTGYGAVYRTISGKNDLVWGRIWSGGSWATPTILHTASTGGVSNSVSGISLISNGTGYGASWNYYYSSIGWSGESNHAAVYNKGSWAESGMGGGYVGTPSIATDGTGYGVAWSDSNPLGPRRIIASIYSAGSWEWRVISSSDLHSYQLKGISGNDSGYAVVWNGAGNFDANVYSGGTWEGVATLETGGANSVVMAGNGSTHTVIWTHSADDTIMEAVHRSDNWNTGTLQVAGEGASSELLVVPHKAADYHAFWVQSGSLNNRRYSSSWLSKVNLLKGTYSGHAENPKLALNATGEGMAVWLQYDNGIKGIWARPISGGAWGTPFLVSTIGENPSVAVNGTHAVVVWQEGSANNDVNSRRFTFSGSTWDPIVPLQADGGTVWPPAVASDGSGFLAVYMSSFSLRYRTSVDGLAWSEEGSATGGGVNPSLVSNGSNYLVLYRSASYPGTSFRGRIFAEGSWGGSSSFGSLNYSQSKIAAAPHGSGYVVAWEANGNDVDARVHNGTSWGSTTQLNTSSSGAFPAVASNGTDAICYFRDGSNQFVTRTFTGGAWEEAVPIPLGGNGGIAATATDFAAIIIRNAESEPGVSSNSHANGVWGHAGGFIEDQSGPASDAQIMNANGNYLGIWEFFSASANAGQIWSTMDN